MIWQNTKPPLGAKINWSHPLSKGIVGCWLFNEGMGDKVYDSSGNGNTGTLSGFSHPSTPTSGWNPGKFGKAIAFDGSNDYIICTANSSAIKLSDTSSFSLISWVNPSVINNNMLYVGEYPTSPQGVFLYVLGHNNNKAFFYIEKKNILGTAIISTNDIEIGKNICVCGTYNGNILNLYVNGIVASSPVTKTFTGSTTNSGIIQMGKYVLNYTGKISHNIIYNKCLSPSEVLQLYQEPFCMFNT
jgi:hypothetical protein